jgi:hypothetical protein
VGDQAGWSHPPDPPDSERFADDSGDHTASGGSFRPSHQRPITQ